MQLTVNTQAADGRKNSSYIVPLRRCYICKIISNTVLAALVCSHTSEECFLIIQRSLQCCAELTPAEIWSASQRSLMKTAVWHLCVLCKRLLLPLWRWNNDIYFSQRKILAVTRACFHGVLKPWADLSLNLKFWNFFLLIVHSVFHLWILQATLTRSGRVCPSVRENGIYQPRVSTMSSLWHWIRERVRFQNMCMKIAINIFTMMYSNVFKMHPIRATTVFQQLICEF